MDKALKKATSWGAQGIKEVHVVHEVPKEPSPKAQCEDAGDQIVGVTVEEDQVWEC